MLEYPFSSEVKEKVKMIFGTYCLNCLSQLHFGFFLSFFVVLLYAGFLKSDLFAVQMLRTNVGILDVSASSLDTSSQLLMDLVSGDKSIVRRVFGKYLHFLLFQIDC